MKRILAPTYHTLLAANGEEALQLLHAESTSCQLILSDVMMPQMDGFTLLENVRAEDQFCHIPFILLTARADQQDKLHGLRIGVDAYMTKPFEIEELLLRVKNLLTNASNRVEQDVEMLPVAKGKTATKVSPGTESPSISKTELEWLKTVEQIADREVRNIQYSVDDLARELLMSRSQTFRKIKKITGMTPKKYLNAVRLQKAKTIFETEDVQTIKEVCIAIGFENSTHFARLFEAEFGINPQHYLRK